MKKAIALVLVGLGLASCSQTEKGATFGAGTGAIVGGLASGNVRGAAIGAAIGGAGGALLGAVSEKKEQCYYRDANGNRYVDACPAGY